MQLQFGELRKTNYIYQMSVTRNFDRLIIYICTRGVLVNFGGSLRTSPTVDNSSNTQKKSTDSLHRTPVVKIGVILHYKVREKKCETVYFLGNKTKGVSQNNPPKAIGKVQHFSAKNAQAPQKPAANPEMCPFKTS